MVSAGGKWFKSGFRFLCLFVGVCVCACLSVRVCVWVSRRCCVLLSGLGFLQTIRNNSTSRLDDLAALAKD